MCRDKNYVIFDREKKRLKMKPIFFYGRRRGSEREREREGKRTKERKAKRNEKKAKDQHKKKVVCGNKQAAASAGAAGVVDAPSTTATPRQSRRLEHCETEDLM